MLAVRREGQARASYPAASRKIRTFSTALVTKYNVTEIADSEVDNAWLGVNISVTKYMGGRPIGGHHRPHGPAIGKL